MFLHAERLFSLQIFLHSIRYLDHTDVNYSQTFMFADMPDVI